MLNGGLVSEFHELVDVYRQASHEVHAVGERRVEIIVFWLVVQQVVHGDVQLYRLVAARALFPPHLRRLQSPQPQPTHRPVVHPCRVHPAHGLWLRLHQGMVATVRAGQGRV